MSLPTADGSFVRSSPLVSVIIPAYNCASLIGETLESVYRQTYRHWEVIVVDDGSTDGTRQALTPHLARIRYFYQSNRGTAAGRNAGARAARGELLAFLDNDDIWLPEKLELQVRVMQDAPECGLVFTDGKTFTADRILLETVLFRRLEEWIRTNVSDDPMVVKGSLVKELFFVNEIVSASSVMVRRECFERSGGFDETITVADDHDLWLRIARVHSVALIRRCLYMWRWRDDSQSGPVPERERRWNEASLVVQEKHLHLVPREMRAAARAHMARLYWDGARHYFRRDQFRDARRMLRGSLRHDRLFVPALIFLVASYCRAPVIHGMRRANRGVRKGMRRVLARFWTIRESGRPVR